MVVVPFILVEYPFMKKHRHKVDFPRSVVNYSFEGSSIFASANKII